MDILKIKDSMKSLWKETFGDSSEYVSLIFDTYFNPEYIAHHEEEDEVIAALLGIPYCFLSSSGTRLRGLYLCGLATRKAYRRRGIMTGLIREINHKAKDKGFDFTFLIPSEDGIKRYYHNLGYIDSFYKKIEYYVKGHKFITDGAEITLKEITVNETEQIMGFLTKKGNEPYKNPASFILLHSEQDWRTVIEEALMSGDKLIVGQHEADIRSVAFCKLTEDSVEIKKIISADEQSEAQLLDGIINKYPEHNLTIIADLEAVLEHNSSNQLWSPFYAQNNGKKAEYEDIAVVEEPYNVSRNARPFGMINILDMKIMLRKTGFNKFKDIEVYSEEELKKMILRKPVGHGSDALEKILDLPEINFSISLMLE